MSATLKPGLDGIVGLDPIYPFGVRHSQYIQDLRNRSSPPQGFTVSGAGGTLHNKTAHATVPNKTVGLSLDDFRLSTGAIVGAVVSQTLPYFSMVSSVKTINFGFAATLGIVAEIVTPSDYSTTVKSQAMGAYVRALAGGTIIKLDGEVRVIGDNVAISADLAPTSVALGTGQTLPQRITMAFSYQTLAKRDVVSMQWNTVGGAASLELFGAFFNYTGEE